MNGQQTFTTPTGRTASTELVAHVWCNFNRAEPELLICRRDAGARHGILARRALTEHTAGLPRLERDPDQPPNVVGFRYNNEVGAESAVLRASEDTLTLLGFRFTNWEKQAPEFYVAGLTLSAPVETAQKPF
ncbi:MAG: hypothetical protein ACXV5Q_04160 [Frankiaceae bacterium]